MENDHNEELAGPEDIRMSNFSQIISILFVTIVMVGLFIKIIFF
jgi:hypothetical protein